MPSKKANVKNEKKAAGRKGGKAAAKSNESS